MCHGSGDDAYPVGVSRTLRNLALLTLPAVAAGGIAAGLLAAFRSPVHGAAADPHAAPAPEDDAPAAEGESPPVSGRHPRRRPRAGSRRIEPELVARLESEDESVRVAAALEILRRGPSQLEDLYALEPRRPESRKLLAGIEEALAALRVIESGQDYPALPDDLKTELRVKYWSRVVPESLLRTERRQVWEAKVARSPERVAAGRMEPGEARWYELELARARMELGEIPPEVWVTVRDAGLPDVRSWTAGLAQRRDVSPARAEEIRRAVEALAR